MSSFTFIAENESETDRLGAALAELLPDGTTVALCGTLGAGKTRLVQAIAAGCGIATVDVVSPTFVLCQQYQGKRMLYHLDAYRLADEDEFLQLGPEEYFDSPAITLIEWADRVEDCLPPNRVEIRIEVSGHSRREFEIRSVGSGYESVITSLSERL